MKSNIRRNSIKGEVLRVIRQRERERKRKRGREKERIRRDKTIKVIKKRERGGMK